MRKLSHDKFVENFFSKHEKDEYTVLGTFVNSSTDILIRHNKCGKVYNSKPYNLYMGKGCRECSAPNKRSHEQFISLIKERYSDEYIILSEYTNSRNKVKVKHMVCGNEYETAADTLLRGHGCKKCAGLIKYTTNEVANKISNVTNGEYEIVGSYIANNKPIKVRHLKCDTIFETTYSLFITLGSRCPLCNKDYKRNNEIFTKEIFYLVGEEYIALSNFENTMKKVRMRHNLCGNEYEVSPNSFFRGIRCPECAFSKGEDKIKKYLKRNNIKYISQYMIKKCSDKRPLRYDFAIINGIEILCLIEYQGIQHYKPVKIFGGINELREREHKDQIKRDYCKANNISLIEIPYTIKNIETYLQNELIKLAPQTGCFFNANN